MSKKPLESVLEVADAIEPDQRAAVIRAIYDKVEREPPVGERYPYLLREIIRSSISEQRLRFTKEYTDNLVEELYSYVASLGPIEPFLSEPQISEIMVNGPDQVFIE